MVRHPLIKETTAIIMTIRNLPGTFILFLSFQMSAGLPDSIGLCLHINLTRFFISSKRGIRRSRRLGKCS